MFHKTAARGLLAATLFLSCLSVQADVFNMPGGQTSVTMVAVGNPGNSSDPATSHGSVSYNYNIDAYDVTLAQYCQFLNSVATSADPYGLYYFDMPQGSGGFPFGISQTWNAVSQSYSYSVTGSNPQAANMPVTWVSWGDAVRFCNWLQNGQPTTGVEDNTTTETGAYTLSGATNNSQLMTVTSPAHSGTGAAMYFLPTYDEWYKAAYYNPSSRTYWTYPTQSNNPPGNNLALALTTSNEANYSKADPINLLTPVGNFVLSPGPYGTFDQGGDASQWLETKTSGVRGDQGASYFWSYPYFASSDGGGLTGLGNHWGDLGFRVASSAAVPEPGSLALLLAGAVGLLAFAWRRRRAKA
jgi:formylglycine-generating enzyme required for sulfatase activity